MIHSHYVTLKACIELLYSLLNDYKYDTIYIFPVIDNNDKLLGYLYNKNLETLIDSILDRACELNSMRKQLDLQYKNCDKSALPNIGYSEKDMLIRYLLQKFDTETGLNFENLDRRDIRQIIVNRIGSYFKTLKHSAGSMEYSSIHNACEDIKALLRSIIALIISENDNDESDEDIMVLLQSIKTLNLSEANNDELNKVALKNTKKAIEYFDSRVKISENYWN
jgi:hypothetical protein